jgi:phosphatidylserine decarboxylase
VGRISLAFTDLVTNRGRAPGPLRPASPIPVRRGDELGAFHLGSSVVLLAAAPALVPAARAGEVVRVGRALFRRASGSASDLA